MTKKLFFILLIPAIAICLSFTDDWKQLDLGSFKISIPKEWNYEKEQGEDSFIGKFTGPKYPLEFDCSSMGYANPLISTEQEYLAGDEWKGQSFFYKVGVIYTASFNVKNARMEEMKKEGITDSTLLKMKVDTIPDYKIKQIHKPTAEQAKKYPKDDYIADLTYRDSTIYVPIEIPVPTKESNIRIDTTDKYIIKTIWPKVTGEGITGVYIKSRTSSFNFNLVGGGLTAKEQKQALQAFKTITFKKK